MMAALIQRAFWVERSSAEKRLKKTMTRSGVISWVEKAKTASAVLVAQRMEQPQSKANNK